jgi:hypothetical protein
MKTSLAASILIAAGAADAAVVPDFRQSPLTTIADRMHSLAVEVVASGDDEKVNTASGVLVGDGIVLTDLRAVLVKSPGGVVEPAREIAVMTAKGAFPARVIGAALAVDVAVLELPQAARGIEGPLLAEGPPAVGEQLLAIRASKQGTALLFEVISFSIEGLDGPRSGSMPPIPGTFVGAPVFDGRGALAGLLVSPSGQEGVLVPAGYLREILSRAHSAVPQVDDHI